MSKVSKTKKALLATLAACAITVVGLVGCSGANEASSAEEVYEHYSQTTQDNYKMDGTIEMNVSAQGMTMDIPMEMHLETADKAVYSTIKTKVLGMDQDTETYVIPEGDNYIVYTGTPNMSSSDTAEKSWTKATTKDASSSMDSMAKLEKSMFEGAEFAKTTDGYTVVVPFSKMISAMNDTNQNNTNELSAMMSQMNDMGLSLDDVKVAYNFDREYHLTKILIEKTEIPFESQGQKGSISIACNLALSDFGKVAAISVPEDIVKSATDTGTIDMSAFEDTTGSASAANSESTTTDSSDAVNAAAEGAKTGAETVIDAASSAAAGTASTSSAASDTAQDTSSSAAAADKK